MKSASAGSDGKKNDSLRPSVVRGGGGLYLINVARPTGDEAAFVSCFQSLSSLDMLF